MGQNTPPVTASDFFSRFKDAGEEAARRSDDDAFANAAGLWELADLYMPPDIQEFADRHHLEHTVPEMWRSAYIQGWRAAMRSRHAAENK